jgi:hypothetical protein
MTFYLELILLVCGGCLSIYILLLATTLQIIYKMLKNFVIKFIFYWRQNKPKIAYYRSCNNNRIEILKGWMAEGGRPDNFESSPPCCDAQSACFGNSRRVTHLEPPHSPSQGIRSRMLHVSGNHWGVPFSFLIHAIVLTVAVVVPQLNFVPLEGLNLSIWAVLKSIWLIIIGHLIEFL